MHFRDGRHLLGLSGQWGTVPPPAAMGRTPAVDGSGLPVDMKDDSAVFGVVDCAIIAYTNRQVWSRS
jgi:hypothetical protein